MAITLYQDKYCDIDQDRMIVREKEESIRSPFVATGMEAQVITETPKKEDNQILLILEDV